MLAKALRHEEYFYSKRDLFYRWEVDFGAWFYFPETVQVVGGCYLGTVSCVAVYFMGHHGKCFTFSDGANVCEVG